MYQTIGTLRCFYGVVAVEKAADPPGSAGSLSHTFHTGAAEFPRTLPFNQDAGQQDSQTLHFFLNNLMFSAHVDPISRWWISICHNRFCTLPPFPDLTSLNSADIGRSQQVVAILASLLVCGNELQACEGSDSPSAGSCRAPPGRSGPPEAKPSVRNASVR